MYETGAGSYADGAVGSVEGMEKGLCKVRRLCPEARPAVHKGDPRTTSKSPCNHRGNSVSQCRLPRNHLRWDSLGEYLALTCSMEDRLGRLSSWDWQHPRRASTHCRTTALNLKSWQDLAKETGNRQRLCLDWDLEARHILVYIQTLTPLPPPRIHAFASAGADLRL